MNLRKVDGLLSRLLPRQCGLCGLPSRNHNTCNGCRDDLPWITRPCERCSAPLPAGYSGRRCGRCDIDTARLAGLHAALVYEYPVDRIVTRAKFHRRPDSARLLGEWLARSLQISGCARADVLVPVPLHRARLATRGFNQAAEVSRAVAERLGMRQAPGGCSRIRDTPAQSDLSGDERRRNVRDVFRASEKLSGLHVAIVDDVVTTGSTLSALADVILAAGALSVSAWVAARTVSGSAKRIVE